MSREKQYLIVAGTTKSGKTLIARSLSVHPEVIVGQEPFLFFFKLCRNIFYRDIVKNDFDPEQPMGTDFCKRSELKRGLVENFPNLYFSKSDIEELIRLTTHQLTYNKNDHRPLKMVPFLDQLKSSSAKEIFKKLLEFLSIAYHKDNLKYIGFDESWCDEFILPILQSSGLKFKCIHSIRDPRAIIASRNASDKLNQIGRKYPILLLIRHWRKVVSYSIINKDDPNYMAIRLEDINASPEKSMKKICKHLDIEFRPEIMENEKFVDGDGKKWKTNSAFKNVSKGFSTSGHEKWKKVLTEKEKGFIEWICKPEMDYFSYAQSIRDYTLKDLTAFVEDESEIKEWLKPYDLLVNDKQISMEIIRRNLIELDGYVSDELKDYLFINRKVYDAFKKLHRQPMFLQ